MRRRRIIQLTAVVVAIVLAVVVLGGNLPGCAPSADLSVAPRIGHVAPDFALPTIDGQTVELSQLRDKWVLFTFWTTWCPACVAQEPYLQAAFLETGGEIEFIGINLGESEQKVREHITADIAFTIALDTGQTVGAAYNIRYLPTTVLVDEEGIIRDIRIGAFQSKEHLLGWLEDATSSGTTPPEG
ncbi:MAG: TlpA disulfide reductase family protein [Dehalococcoidia bacterium]